MHWSGARVIGGFDVREGVSINKMSPQRPPARRLEIILKANMSGFASSAVDDGVIVNLKIYARATRAQVDGLCCVLPASSFCVVYKDLDGQGWQGCMR